MEREEYARMYALEDDYWWFVGKRRIAETLIHQYVLPAEDVRVLDLGCGTGGVLHHLLGGQGRAYGLDLSEVALEFAQQRRLTRLALGTAARLPYGDGSFGLVTALDLLYHRWVADDSAVLRECWRVLRPGGWLLVMDSAFQFLYGEHDLRHLGQRRYTAFDLRTRVESVGLRTEKLSYVNALLFPAVATIRLFSRVFGTRSGGDFMLRPLPRWLNGLLTGTYALEARGLQWFSYPFGASVVCLARKTPGCPG
jgi:ubiquinone/menaquinone biosynthesis C-methylase UbiE